MASRNDAINYALLLLSQAGIVLGEKSSMDKKIDQCYSIVKKNFLCVYPWSVAKRRVVLDIPMEIPPPFGYSASFTLPSDYLAIYMVCDPWGEPVSPMEKYTIENRKIFINMSPVYLIYLTDDVSVQDFSPPMVSAFAGSIAISLAQSVTGKKSTLDTVASMFSEELKNAKTLDNSESFDVSDQSYWEAKRFS